MTEDERKRRNALSKKRWKAANAESVSLGKKKWREGHREQLALAEKKRREEKPELYASLRKARRMESRYGITLDQWNKMFEMGNGACWICKKSTRKDGKPLILHTDHDHVTKRVRGILCFQCNTRVIGRHRTGSLLLVGSAYLDSTFDGRNL